MCAGVIGYAQRETEEGEADEEEGEPAERRPRPRD